MPIQRLDEQPTRRAVLADITCDSDGRLDRFIGEGEIQRALDVHELDDRPYYLGVFLVGAYQETLGDLHNLFGDAHAVHIRIEDGQWAIEEVVSGDTAGEVLSYVQFDPKQFESQMRKDCERAVRANCMTVRESKALLRFYETGLSSYTYLQS
jgi:arginine decarboxylase